jgi:hypothetical protein
LRPYLTGPEALALADTLATQHIGGLPAGGIALAEAGKGLGGIADKLLGRVKVAP